MLQAQKLQKVYAQGRNRIEVLKGIDLQIKKGEILAVVGPSGAGKSTLLHLLGGLDRPTQGKVFFEGVDFESLGDRELSEVRNRRIGFVFQFYHLLPEFNLLENVLLPAFIKFNDTDFTYRQKKLQIKQRATKILEQVGLRERLNHHPNELSGGEQQRVTIARALINEPDLLLCDEPTGNLDSENGKGVCALLERLNRQNNVTIALVTHNEELAGIAHRVVHLKDGLIIN